MRETGITTKFEQQKSSIITLILVEINSTFLKNVVFIGVFITLIEY